MTCVARQGYDVKLQQWKTSGFWVENSKEKVKEIHAQIIGYLIEKLTRKAWTLCDWACPPLWVLYFASRAYKLVTTGFLSWRHKMHVSREKAMFISLGSPTADSLNLSRGNPTVYGRTIKQLPSHLVPLFRIGSFSKTLVWVAWKYICRETKTCFCTEAKGNCHCRGAVASWLAR